MGTKVANASRVPIEDFRNEARRLKAGLSTVQKLRAEADSDLRKEESDSLSKERSLMGARDPCRRRRKWASSGSRVPRHQEYLAAAKLRASFQERYDKIDEGSRVAIDAAQSLVQSRGLTLVLQRILAVGNAMNAGTSIGDARGIRLGSLLAIVKTKGRDRQTSVLDYVVQGLLKRGHARVLTEVVVSLKTKVANASRVPIEDFRNEARRLKAGLATVQKLRAEADSDLRKE